MSVAFAAMLAVGCGRDANDRTNNDADRPAATADSPAVGTAGERPAADRDANGPGMGVRNWVQDRLVGGMTEVKLGEMASQKAQSADVKAFGRMMVQDHTKAGEQLKQLASTGNITPPADLDDDHRDKVERLSKLTGAEFDREYINQMVDDHEATVNALEDRLDKEGDDDNPRYTAKTSDDQFENQVNQWAAKTIPTVRKHLERAKQLDQKMDRRTTNDENAAGAARQ
jgi:predicted outer membrane protein